MTGFLLVNASQVVTCAGPPRRRRGAAMADAAAREGYAVAVSGAMIASRPWASRTICGARYPDAECVDCDRGPARAGVRGFAHPRHLRARPRPPSRSCARPGWTTWRSRGGAGGSTPRCAISARRPSTSCATLARGRLRLLARERGHDGRGEVRVRTHARRRAQDAARDPAAARRAAPAHRADIPRRARGAAGAPRQRRPRRAGICRHADPRHDSARRCGGVGAVRRRLLRDPRLHAGRVARDSAGGAGAPGSGSSCTPTS